MKKSLKPNQFLNEAFFKGGEKALGAFISQNLKYPEEALKNRKEGTVKVRFDINHKGKVIEATALNKLGFGLEEEAQRVVKLLRYECNVPRGMKAVFHKKLDIHFKLPPKKKGVQMNYSYTHTPKKVAQEKVEKKKNITSYSYTVKFKKASS